ILAFRRNSRPSRFFTASSHMVPRRIVRVAHDTTWRVPEAVPRDQWQPQSLACGAAPGEQIPEVAWSLFAGWGNEVVRARLPRAGQLCFKPSRTGRLVGRFPLLLFVFVRPNSPALE